MQFKSKGNIINARVNLKANTLKANIDKYTVVVVRIEIEITPNNDIYL